MIKLIFFDFDGVLAESLDIKTEAFAALFEKKGKEISGKVTGYHLKNPGVSRYEKFRYIYKNILGTPLGDSEFERLCNDFSKLVVDRVVKAPFVKGSGEFLRENRGKYRLFVLSATPDGEIKDIIRKRNMKDFFLGVHGSPGKKRDFVKEILEKECVKPEEALYIGDGLSDWRAAGDNDVRFIARVTEENTLFDSVGCLKIKDLCGLKGLIEAL